MAKKNCALDNAFGGKGGFEGLYSGLKKEKRMKLFPSQEDAENEARQVPKVWGNKRC